MANYTDHLGCVWQYSEHFRKTDLFILHGIVSISQMREWRQHCRSLLASGTAGIQRQADCGAQTLSQDTMLLLTFTFIKTLL